MINIILGPPGTGKTTKLLNICQEKKEQGISWDKIGFFSFSKKAAYEARDRAGAVTIGEASLFLWTN